jgi:hypothetical protein
MYDDKRTTISWQISPLQETAIQVAYSSKLIGQKDQVLIINANDLVSLWTVTILQSASEFVTNFCFLFWHLNSHTRWWNVFCDVEIVVQNFYFVKYRPAQKISWNTTCSRLNATPRDKPSPPPQGRSRSTLWSSMAAHSPTPYTNRWRTPFWNSLKCVPLSCVVGPLPYRR